MNNIEACDIIKAARDFAARLPNRDKQESASAPTFAKAFEHAYLRGAIEMLKRLQDDSTPEPWSDDYDHEARLRELLASRPPDYRAEYLNALHELGILRAECEGYRQRLAAELETKTK